MGETTNEQPRPVFEALLEVSVAALTIRLRSELPNFLSRRIVKSTSFSLMVFRCSNEDNEKRPPSSVLELKKRIRSSDAVLIVTPEYNYSIPGVLKNAIDWASRPHGDSPWSGKSAAIMGA